jgi:hypothetical protein
LLSLNRFMKLNLILLSWLDLKISQFVHCR